MYQYGIYETVWYTDLQWDLEWEKLLEEETLYYYLGSMPNVINDTSFPSLAVGSCSVANIEFVK